MEYKKGRINLSATIFVPYDCKNNCTFCTSKVDYKDRSSFSLEHILKRIEELNQNEIIQEYVITGGEPFANISLLKQILKVTKKPVYLNTTLPDTEEVRNFIPQLSAWDCIKGINISRHMAFDFNNVFSIEQINEIVKPVRINTVITDGFVWEDFWMFCDRYGKKKRDINLRADYRLMTFDSLKARDRISVKLSEHYDYIESESCMVCNSEYYNAGEKFICTYHRGMQYSSVIVGEKCYVSDVIVKQDGRMYKDWDCVPDPDFERWILHQ